MFIKAVNVYGKPVLINTDHIVSVSPDSDPEGCWVKFLNESHDKFFSIPFEEFSGALFGMCQDESN